MHLKPEEFITLIDAIARLFDIIGIRSHGGRVMLGTELVIGVFMLLAFALLLLHEILAALYSLARAQEFSFHSDRSFMIFSGIIAFSFIIVLIREALARDGRSGL